MGLNDRFSTVERASRTAINLHENDQELEEEEEDDMICSFDQTQASIFHNETRASFNNKFNPVLGKQNSHRLEYDEDVLSDIFDEGADEETI